MAIRVVVTGMGVVSPVGNGLNDFWTNLCNGKSGIVRIDRFDPSAFRSQIAGLVPPVTLNGASEKDLRRLDPYTVYAMAASDEAWKQSGLDVNVENPERIGVVVGSGIGGIKTIAEEVVRLHEGGPRRVSPMMIPKGLSNMASGNIAIRYGLQGPNKCVVSACATSNHCIGDAVSLIRAAEADVILAGGAEAPIVPFGLAGFGAMRALSTRNDEPQRASRPFDKDRDGFVSAEGAGILVLESEEHAKARGAEILGEVGGIGETCDAYHVTAPLPDASVGARALKLSMDKAGVNSSDVGYFNAHGTSTPYNDAGESKALRAVFGQDMPPVSSTKSMMGHLLGAAGAVEAIACLLAIRHGVIPPNINYETPDPECDVNIVANEAREQNVEIALSNSLGFGGHNAALVCKRYV